MVTGMQQKILIVCVFIAADLVSGIIKALSSGTYESAKMRAGLFHKLGELMAWALCYAVDQFSPALGIALPFQLTSAVTVYIVIMEIGSIVENIGIINPEIGKYLTGIFEKVREQHDVEER